MKVKKRVYSIDPKTEDETRFVTEHAIIKSRTYTISPLNSESDGLLVVTGDEPSRLLPEQSYIPLEEATALTYKDEQELRSLASAGKIESLARGDQLYLEEQSLKDYIERVNWW